MLKRVVVVPANERWLYEPAMKAKLTRAHDWAHNTPAQEADLDTLASRLGIAA
jgi:hypothetical protein